MCGVGNMSWPKASLPASFISIAVVTNSDQPTETGSSLLDREATCLFQGPNTCAMMPPLFETIYIGGDSLVSSSFPDFSSFPSGISSIGVSEGCHHYSGESFVLHFFPT